MIYTDYTLTKQAKYPTYPPYHVGDYLEDYFIKRYKEEQPSLSRDYIGISWTTLYCDGERDKIQPFLDSLPKDKKYFTVSQHDDAPGDNLPEDTLCFSAGGNIEDKNIVPIPLICSKIDIQYNDVHDRNILASFVGSTTHPIRTILHNTFLNNSNIKIYSKCWNPTVTENEFMTFIATSLNSKFCLCPRGYGLNSFRLYEAMQLGCIPVIITDKFYLPWQDELNWNEFSVLIHSDHISEIENILLSYSDLQIKQMKEKLKLIYDEYFTMNGLYNNIIKRLKND